MKGRLRPCPGMARPLSRLVDGNLGQFMTWFIGNHTKHCPTCNATYRAMLALRDGLRKVGKESAATNLLSEEQWRMIDEACKQ